MPSARQTLKLRVLPIAHTTSYTQHMTTLAHYLPLPFFAEVCYYHIDTKEIQHKMAPPRRPPPPVPTHATLNRPSSTSFSTSTSPASSTRSLSPTFVEHLTPSQIQALALTARRKQTQSHHKLSQILGDAMLLDVLELELKAERRRSYTRPSTMSNDRGRARQRAEAATTSVTEVEVDEDD